METDVETEWKRMWKRNGNGMETDRRRLCMQGPQQPLSHCVFIHINNKARPAVSCQDHDEDLAEMRVRRVRTPCEFHVQVIP
jgi:hypothetical protein